MDFTFTSNKNELQIPTIEDARADFAPYYSSRSTIKDAQRQVLDELGKLGGFGGQFYDGYFGTGKDKRYGYMLRFMYGGAPGLIRVAGLPIAGKHTESKQIKVKVQALLNVRDWLKSAVTAQIFAPGSEPLMQLLLVDGKRTVADVIAETGKLPRTNPSPLLGSGDE